MSLTRRDGAAAKRFFRKALRQPHTVNPRTITVDKNAAYPKAVAEMKGVLLQTWLKSRASACGGLWSGGELEQFSDEGCLSLHVAAADLPNLPLPHHRHRLVASQGSSGGSEAGEAEPRPGQAFDPPMVLFRDVVQYLHCRSRVRRHSSPAPFISATAFG